MNQQLLPAEHTIDSDLQEIQYCMLCGQSEFIERFPNTRNTRPIDYDAKAYTAYLCTHPAYGVHPPIVECTNCGLLFTNPRPTPESIAANYTNVEDQTYLDAEAARFATFKRRLQWLEEHSGVGTGRRILDIGAYTGVFVEVAAQAGWDAYGLEPSHWAVLQAQQLDRQVMQGLIQQHPFEAASFDAITMWDVIEHVPDPVEVLREAYQLLKPGAWIAVHTMDTHSRFAKLMGSRWPWLMEMHIVYFTRKTLKETIEAAGFEVHEVKAEGRYLQLQYLVSRLQSYNQPLYKLLDAITRATGLSKINIPLNFGDLITAYATKPEG